MKQHRGGVEYVRLFRKAPTEEQLKEAEEYLKKAEVYLSELNTILKRKGGPIVIWAMAKYTCHIYRKLKKDYEREFESFKKRSIRNS